MQYKTTIEVRTDAENEYEAADIAGSLLKGELENGADITVSTISVVKSQMIKTAVAACSVAAVTASFFIGNQVYSRIASAEKKNITSYAIQPPLKTNMTKDNDFTNAWKKIQNKRIDSATR